MQNDDFERLYGQLRAIGEPENLFSGLRLPRGFALPDNILVFHHDFTAASPNAHGRYTLVIPLDKMTYFVEQMQFELEPGGAMLIPPHALRYLHPGSTGYRRLFITFELPIHQEYLPKTKQNRLTPEAWRKLWSVLDSYHRNLPEECALHLFQLLQKMDAAPEPDNAAPRLPLPVARAIEFMAKNLKHPIGVPEVAEHAGLSEGHLRVLFRKHTGITPGRYLLRQRLDAAKYRLLHTDGDVAEIAESCGFANVFVFGGIFRKHIGIPPGRYRKQNRP